MRYGEIGLLVALLLMAVSSTSVADDDPIKLKLDKAKVAYDEAIYKFRIAAGEYFDKREDAARKDGNKKLVDEIKAERRVFDEKGELPNSAPLTLRQKATAANTSLENAYILAIKEYTKAKRDDEASAAERELMAFKAGLPESDTRQRWVHEKGEFKMIGKDLWEENWLGKKAYQYKETARTKEYVQLDALNGDTTVRYRLYDTRCDQNLKPKQTYAKDFFKGKWVK